jgi:non-heme chloroperoxidase
MKNLGIARAWTVISADRKRVGDVTEVHPHYLLVSRGVLRVKDMFMPLGSVDRTEGTTVILSVTWDALRKMDLSHEPPPPAETELEPLNDPPPMPTGGYAPDLASAEAGQADNGMNDAGTDWQNGDAFEESPSYERPLPNGLIEAEHALNIACADLGYGMPIVLLQGWPFDSTIWEPLPYELAIYNRVITYDMRGTGDSDKPWDFYAVETLTQDLHRVMIEQALHNTTLVAWSMAVPVALRYALDHPKRLARLVLISPLIPAWLAEEDAALWVGRQPEFDREAQLRWETELLEDRPALFERLVDRLTISPLGASRRTWLVQRLLRGAQHAQIKLFDSLRTDDPDSFLSDIQTPVTIVHGLHDRLSPLAVAQRLAERLPRAQVVELEDCGHAPFIDQREVVSKAISDLVNSLSDLPVSEEESLDTSTLMDENDFSTGDGDTPRTPADDLEGSAVSDLYQPASTGTEMERE